MAEMQPTTEILTRISKNSLNNKDEVFTRLFRYLLREDIWFEAYRNLYANNGASTKGVSLKNNLHPMKKKKGHSQASHGEMA